MNLTKDQKIKLGCIIVMLLLVPSFVIYYEYSIAAANNAAMMRQHASSQPVTATDINNLTSTKTGSTQP